jgi:VWFA-related protein
VSIRGLNLFTLVAVVTAQVQVGSDEISVRSTPYSPLSAAGIIRTQVDLVEVPVVVRDGKGVAIPDLKRENFEILDSGKKREIASFSVETFTGTAAVTATSAVAAPKATAAPSDPAKPEIPRRFIGLILDDLNTNFDSLRRAKTAAGQFVAKSLTPGDLVAIFTTASPQTALFTGDKQKLEKAIEAVTARPRYSDNLITCPRIRAYEAYLIANRIDDDILKDKASELTACRPGIPPREAEEVVRSIANGVWDSARGNAQDTLRSIGWVVASLAKMPGRRMVLLTSGGFLTGNVEDWLQDLITLALHNGVIVNSMDLKGLYAVVPGGDASEETKLPGVRPQPRAIQHQQAELKIQGRMEDAKDDGLAVLASGTGGRFYQNNNDLAAGFRTLGALPEVMYVLGFSSGDVPADGKYHSLRVRLTGGKQGSVQARMGYNALPKEPPADLARQRERDRVIMGSDAPSDVAVRITNESVKTDSGPAFSVKAEIDLNRLNFQTKQDRRTQKLTVIAALLDQSGNFVTGKQGEAELALKDTTFAAMAPVGLGLSLSLSATPGSYKLRVLVQESVTGKSTAVSRSVQIR